MDTLKKGSTGSDVVLLQSQLQALGYSVGSCDGIFGPKTQVAVMAFQRHAGLTPDGVAGPQTSAALSAAFGAGMATTETMPQVSVQVVAKMLPDAPQAKIEANLPSVLLALQAAGLTALPLVMAALATIAAETAGFEPIAEQVSHYNTSPGGRPFDLYDTRKDLGNLGPDDGADFRGRGYVQLTGRNNYTTFGPLAGAPDLVSQPEQACDPDTAASLLAAFIKTNASAISAALSRNDLAGAREQVNGGSHGLQQFTFAYHTGMALMGAHPAKPA
jgi:peptidoglycan L-alanyl-D-glutamate endopeptidase CwlK